MITDNTVNAWQRKPLTPSRPISASDKERIEELKAMGITLDANGNPTGDPFQGTPTPAPVPTISAWKRMMIRPNRSPVSRRTTLNRFPAMTRQRRSRIPNLNPRPPEAWKSANRTPARLSRR